MSVTFIIASLIEIAIATALIIGFFFEERVADFEEMIFKSLKRFIISRRKAQQIRRANNTQKFVSEYNY